MKTLDRILSAARADPDRTAFRLHHLNGETESLTYGELLTRAEALADRLREQGTGPVLTDARQTPDSVVSILACLMAERPYVPLPPNAPPARLQTMARLSGATLMTAPDSVPDMGIPRMPADRTAPLPPEPLRLSIKERYGEDGCAYILFTSGSTGRPKGVPVSRRSLDSFTGWISSPELFPPKRGMTVLNQALFSFDLSAADLYFSLCGGHTLAAADGPDALLPALSEADAAVMTPSLLRLLLLDRTFDAERYPRLSCVYLCGETLSPGTARRALTAFPRLRLINAYGPTEACSAVCAVRITPDMADTLPALPVGDLSRAAADIRIEDGEIVLRGDSVFGGYLPDPEAGDLTRSVFREGSVNGYRTGDLGELRDGLLWFGGRRDSQIKYKGYRVETGDIEGNLRALPGVLDCAVVPKRNAVGEILALCAFVIRDPDSDALPKEPDAAERILKEALAARIPAYMIPKTIRFPDRLPVTENGKTDRGALVP